MDDAIKLIFDVAAFASIMVLVVSGLAVIASLMGIFNLGHGEFVLLGEGGVVAAGPPAEVVRPETIERAFGIRADVVDGPDGGAVVVPREVASPAAD